MNLPDKINIAQLLEKMGVDAIEVGYADIKRIFRKYSIFLK